MPALIAFRAVQGLGAGAVQPMAITIAGDIYTVAERAKVQGYIAAVWASASVVGPTLGGVFSEYLDWSWIFFVNVPLGLVAAWLLVTQVPRVGRAHLAPIDWLGGVLLTVVDEPDHPRRCSRAGTPGRGTPRRASGRSGPASCCSARSS